MRKNLIVMTERGAHTISQEDILELMMLSRESIDARKRWKAKRDYIKAALRAGVPIEPGATTVQLGSRSRVVVR